MGDALPWILGGFTHMSGILKVWDQLGQSTEVSTCNLFSMEASRYSRVHKQGRGCKTFCDLVQEVTQHNFFHTILVFQLEAAISMPRFMKREPRHQLLVGRVPKNNTQPCFTNFTSKFVETHLLSMYVCMQQEARGHLILMLMKFTICITYEGPPNKNHSSNN